MEFSRQEDWSGLPIPPVGIFPTQESNLFSCTAGRFFTLWAMLDLKKYFASICCVYCDFLGGSVVKNLPANAGDPGLNSVLGRSSGEWNGNPLQCSCLENPMNRGAWKASIHGVAKELDHDLGTKQQQLGLLWLLELMNVFFLNVSTWISNILNTDRCNTHKQKLFRILSNFFLKDNFFFLYYFWPCSVECTGS